MSSPMQELASQLAALDGVQGKVGWFESARYENGKTVAEIMAGNEFGVASRSIPPRPFFRPTAAEKKNEWIATAKKLCTAVLHGQITADQAMEGLTIKAENDVLKTIVNLKSPPLSKITLGARKYKKEGKQVTGATIGEIARLLKEGKLDVSGVSDDPLNDSGHAIATLTHVVENTK